MAKKYEVAGPWDDEPDELAFIDERTGYRCQVVRVEKLGHLCGYVEVPAGHPLFGVSYGAHITKNQPRHLFAEWFLAEHDWDSVGGLFEVHGGVTFSGFAYWDDDKGHWFGFDCGHCDDLSPGMGDYAFRRGGTYRDLEYVKAQCASLAKQLHQMVA